jgi:hypothetical protein
MARSSFLGTVALPFVLLAACSGKDPFKPGTAVGTFHVTSKLTKSSCGSVPDPWEFDVRLRHDRTVLYWVQGGTPIQGYVDGRARAQLKSELTQVLRPADARLKTPACTVTRTDTLDVQLVAADAQPVSDPAQTQRFGGVLGYRFAPTNDSDCGDQLLTTGGDFETLPCDVAYAIEGVLSVAGEENPG